MKKISALDGVRILSFLYILGWAAYGFYRTPFILFLLSVCYIPLLVFTIIITHLYKKEESYTRSFIDVIKKFNESARNFLHQWSEYLSNQGAQIKLSPRFEQLVRSISELNRTTRPQIVQILQRLSDLHQEMEESFISMFSQSANQLNGLREKGKEYEKLDTELQSLCSVHIPLSVTREWKTTIQQEWDRLSAETLESLSRIKEMQDSSTRFIEEVVKQFQIQQNSYETYTETYQSSLKRYFEQIEGIRTAYIQDLDTSNQEIRNTFAQFDQIADIVERVKLISLNMSIEASKVKGSSAFGLLARELRRLAEYTDDTIKRITSKIQEALQKVELSKENQTREFSNIMGIIDHFKNVSVQYDSTTAELTGYIHKAIHQIQSIQEQEKTIILQFFKNLQDIAIRKEELHHLIDYQETFLNRTNDTVHKLVREGKPCQDTSCPDRKDALDLLASIITTDGERQLVNRIFKELLGVQREQEHGKVEPGEEGIVLF